MSSKSPRNRKRSKSPASGDDSEDESHRRKRARVGQKALALSGGDAKPRLALLWRAGKYTDVTIQVPTQSGQGRDVQGPHSDFHAHRLVLASESKFLDALFDGEFKDSKSSTVVIRDICADVFALVLDYMYDGSCMVTSQMIEPLIAAASFLQFDGLLSESANAWQKQVSPKNCVAAMVCADRYSLRELARTAEDVAKRDFVQVGSDPSVPYASMLSMLKSDGIRRMSAAYFRTPTSEKQIFKTLSKWLRGQTQPLGDDQQLILLACVRFPKIPQSFIDSTVVKEPALKTLAGRNLLFRSFQEAYFSTVKRLPDSDEDSSDEDSD